MADTYRGLTIRIGGDTTQLSNAIKGVNRDASNLESILRKTSQALKINPASLKAAELRMQALSDKSTDLYAKAKILSTAYEQIRISDEFKKAQAYVEKTGDSVGSATTRFNTLNSELEKIKRGFAELDGVDTSIQKNYTEWNKSAQENIKSMRDLGVITQEDYEKYRQLVSAQQQAQDAMDMTKSVAQMRDLDAEITKTKETAKSLAQQYVDLRVKQSAIKGTDTFKETEAELAKTKMTALTLEQQLEKVDKALDLDPQSIATLSLKMQLLAEKSSNSKTELEQVRKRLSELGNMDGVVSDAKNVNQELTKWRTSLENSVQELNQAKAAAASLKQELTEAMTAGKSSGGRTFTELREEITKTENKIKELETAQKGIDAGFTTAKAQKEYQDLTIKARTLENAITDCDKQMGNSNRGFEGWSSSLTNVGLSLTATVIPSLQQFISASAESAQEIDSSYRNMRKTVNGTEEDFEALKQSALNFSKTHVTSADQILEIQAMGGQLGIAVNDLDKFSQTVSNLNIATNISDAEEMSEKLGQLASITGMTSNEYDKFADSLVRLGNNTPTLESNIMDVSSRIGSMASIVGMSVPDILALSTAVAATGQQSEAAGTAISNTMSDIENAVGKGGEALEGFASVAGMSAENFANTWNTSPIEAIKSFITGLKDIESSGGSADTTLNDLGITGVRQKQALLGLTQTVDVLNDSLTMSNDAWNGVSDQWGNAGDAAREAERKAEGFSGQMSILENNMQVLGATVADSLAPWLEKANELFGVVSSAVDGLDDSQKQAIISLAGMVTALGPLLTIAGALIPVFTRLKNQNLLMQAQMEAFGVAAKGTINPIGSLGKKMSGLPSVLGKAGSAMSKFGSLSIGAQGAIISLALIIGQQLVSAIQDYVQKQEQFKQSTDGLVNAQKDAQKAVEEMGISTSSTAGEVDNATVSYKGLSKAMEESAKQGADMAEEQKNWWTEYYTNSKLVERYISTIEDLGSKGELTKGEIAKLQNAVEGYNKITGDSVTITDEVTGSLSKSNDELRANADNWREAAEAQAYQKFMGEAIEKSVKDQENLTKAQQAYNDALNAMAEGNQIAGAGEEQRKQLQEATKAFNDSTIAAQNYEDKLNGTGQSMLSWIGSNKNYTDALAQNGVKIDSFTNYVKSLGLSQEQLAMKTPQEVNAMVLAYANLSNSSVGFDRAKAAVDGLGLSQEQVSTLSPNQIAIITNAYQTMQDAGMNVDEVKNKVGELGISQEQLAGLTSDQMAIIVGAYQSGNADIQTICEHIKNGTIDKLGQAGSGGGSAYASSLGGTTDKASGAGQSVADAAKNPIEQVKNESGTWGSDAGWNFAQGLSDAGTWVSNAASDLAEKAAAFLKHSVPKKGILHEGGKGEYVWGLHLAQNIAEGIQGGIPNVVDSVEAMNLQAKKAMEASDLAASVVYSADMASGGSAFSGVTNNTTIYQIGNVTIPADSKDGETVEDFINLVLAYKGAM